MACRTMLKALATDPTGYGLEAADVAPVRALVDEFGARVQSVDQLEATRAAEVARKNQARTEMEAGVRSLVRRVKAQPGIEVGLLEKAGIPVTDGIRSSMAPITPTHLTAISDAAGANHLKWQRAGNHSNALFEIEARYGSATDFARLDVVRAARYTHKDQDPAIQIVYRVRARHSNQTSGPSNEAVVHPQ